MPALWITLGVAGFLATVTLLVALICFFQIFYSARRPETREYPVPEGEIYEPYREQMVNWVKDARALPCRRVEVTSHDGLTLRGRYFEVDPNAPMELMFHGYRGTSERDLSGGIFRCFALGRNALLVDHRASGESEGHVITFGIKERRDVETWVDFVLRELNPNARIILTGISMGAATVLTTAGEAADRLPPNVVGVLADCGYTSARDIIKKVMGDMGFPAGLLYPFARLGARLFGGFDPDETSPLTALSHCRLPVILIHGDADAFVPCSMSERNYAACASPRKHLTLIPGAGHGLGYPADPDTYLSELRAFFDPILGK